MHCSRLCLDIHVYELLPYEPPMRPHLVLQTVALQHQHGLQMFFINCCCCYLVLQPRVCVCGCVYNKMTLIITL